MSVIYDYLNWRGDISFEAVGIDEADYVTFCCISYLPFDGIVDKNPEESIYLRNAVEHVVELVAAGEKKYLNKGDDRLAEQLTQSPRFSDIKICGFVNKIDAQKEEQFCAMTMVLPSGDIVIAFRGTDSTLIGWKEDFNMGFMDELPSQRDAVKYVEKIASIYPDGNIHVCGHSKGGNLAMYSSSFCKREVQDRIPAVRNMDGPGFSEEVLAKEGAQHIISRTKTYVPQDSVVGMLLAHAEPYYVVHSINFSIMQHYQNSWEINRGQLVKDEGTTESSQLIDAALKNWIREMAPEKREKLIDGFYAVIQTSDATTLAELATGKSTLAVLKALSKTDEETKELFKTAYRIFKQSLKKSLPVVKHLKSGMKEAQPAQT